MFILVAGIFLRPLATRISNQRLMTSWIDRVMPEGVESISLNIYHTVLLDSPNDLQPPTIPT